MEKLRVDQAVVVEGKYDKIALSSVIDGVIITTDGFGVFSDEDTVRLIRSYASACGVIVLTDSDTAGSKIRGHIKSICPEGTVINIYAPVIKGKERRKQHPSKEGLLGVEGIDPGKLRKLFETAGIGGDVSPREPVTKQDMINLGLSGAENSSEIRRRIALSLGLPERLSSAALRDAVSVMLGRERFIELAAEFIEVDPDDKH